MTFPRRYDKIITEDRKAQRALFQSKNLFGGVFMGKKFVVTIGRQYGSGGREIGKKLAEKTGAEFYDKELITLAAKKHGMSEKVFESVDEKPTNSLLYSLAVGAYGMDGGSPYWGETVLPINDKVYQIQAGLIEELAEKGSCVIVGRCADFILRDRKDTVSVFLTADEAFREDRAVNLYGCDPKKVSDIIRKTDKKRSNYYEYRTNQRWGEASHYDLCINVSKFGIDNCVELIEKYIELR